MRDWIDLGYSRRNLEESRIQSKLEQAEYQQRKSVLIRQEDKVIKSLPEEYKEYIAPHTPFTIKVWLDIGVDRKKLEQARAEDKLSVIEYEAERKKLLDREDLVVTEYPRRMLRTF